MSKLNLQTHASSNILIPPAAGGVSSPLPPAPGHADQIMRPAATPALLSDPNAPAPYPNQSYHLAGKSATAPGPAANGVSPVHASSAPASVFRDSSTTTTTSSSPVISALGPTAGMNANRRGVKTHNNTKRGPSRSGTGSTGSVGAGAAQSLNSRGTGSAVVNVSGGTPVVANKRRCVSNACIACRKRKSKCDGNTPSCAACSSVYGTECVYDPSSDHRRKGVYKKDIDNLKTRNGTLQTLIQAILDSPEDQVADLVQAMRTSDNLEDVADLVIEGKFNPGPTGVGSSAFSVPVRGGGSMGARSKSNWSEMEGEDGRMDRDDGSASSSSDREPTFESELSQRMSQLRVDSESGQVRFIGGTSNLILLPSQVQKHDRTSRQGSPNFGRETLERRLADPYLTDRERNPVLSWTNVLGTSPQACEAVDHLLQMYFAWHYPYFTTLSRELFFRDFCAGYSSPVSGLSPRHIPDSPSFNPHSPSPAPSATQPMRYCTPLLVNAMLALGCHFTAHPSARTDKDDPDTAGDHFFYECKRLILENDEHVTPRLTTVQALALMSVREAGCAREERGWSYSGMSFRMGIEMGLNLDLEGSDDKGPEGASRQRNIGRSGRMNDEELDARRITFWGCFLFDKCWSNYMGRMPQLPTSMVSVQKYIIIPSEDAAEWCPYTDVGKSMISAQPARTRAVGLHMIELCEISSDLLIQFYNPNPKKTTIGVGSAGRSSGIPGGPGKSEIRNLGSLWQRLEDWRKKLPRELEPQQGCLPPVLLMHMFHQLLYIHLFRPFLQSISATLPTLSLDPRKICVEAASKISKYLRFYKREYGLRQICNIAAYMIHSACTIHLLNLPEKSAKRDIVQGLRSLEDMAEGWLCARRALVIIRILAKRWKIDLPDEGVVILARAAKGRAEQFGLQEVPDEDYESSYLDYRGSSASAVSPMSLASDRPLKQPSVPAMETNQTDSGMQPGSLQPSAVNKPTMSASRKGSNVSSHSSPRLGPSPAPRQKIRQQRPQQQQKPQQQKHQQQEHLSQVAPGFRYHTDESAASSPGAYVPLSPFTHQMQTSYSQQHQYVPDRSSPLLIQGVGSTSTPPPPPPPQPQQSYQPHSPGAPPAPAQRVTRDLSTNSQNQYSYFDNPHPPSSIASPSAFYSDAGIPMGYGHTPDELQGTAMEPNWCIRDQELVARGFLVQGWMSGELGTRGSLGGSAGGAGGGSGAGGGGDGVRAGQGENPDEGGGVDGETPWDPFRVY